jgi:hypothetical protein
MVPPRATDETIEMSLRWTVDHDKRLMTVVAEGDVARADLEAYLRAVAEAGAMGYRKLYDGSRSDTSMTPDDLLALGAAMRDHHRSGPMGPLAFVIPPERMDVLRRFIGALAAADRPMRVFYDVDLATRWLDKQAPAPAQVQK